jgi:hypothetical protein
VTKNKGAKHMTYNILILGASYGSLLGTKLLMAGHDVTLVCRKVTSQLINQKGTEVRIKLINEAEHRVLRSSEFPGTLEAKTPKEVDPSDFDLICLAMQEPHYDAYEIRALMLLIAKAGVPCLSIMNMPPPPYLKRIPNIDASKLDTCYTNPRIWDNFDPDLMTLCSPDPQAFRPPEKNSNFLHVGLPTNFKTAAFGISRHNAILKQLEAEISAIRLDGQEVPVKLRVFDSLFVPLAKWSMLLTGNYRCITGNGVRSICDAVNEDPKQSREIYAFVNSLVQRLGAETSDHVPFEKYMSASQNLLKPSSAARAISGGETVIERPDKLVQLIGKTFGMINFEIDKSVAIIDKKLSENKRLRA